MGYSAPTSTVTIVPRRVPSAPTNVKLAVVSGTQLEVSFNPPTSNGGDTIKKYIVQWDTVESFNSNGAWMTNGTATVEGGAIAGTPPFTYLIGSGTPLLTGTPYFVRVRAENSVAYQQIDLEDITTYNYAHERSTPLSAIPANRAPTAPLSVGLSLVALTNFATFNNSTSKIWWTISYLLLSQLGRHFHFYWIVCSCRKCNSLDIINATTWCWGVHMFTTLVG